MRWHLEHLLCCMFLGTSGSAVSAQVPPVVQEARPPPTWSPLSLAGLGIEVAAGALLLGAGASMAGAQQQAGILADRLRAFAIALSALGVTAIGAGIGLVTWDRLDRPYEVELGLPP